MSEQDRLIIDGKLRIISPVHIGGAQEKHLQKGLDFIDKNGVVYVLNQNALINHFGIDKYSNAIATNRLEQLCHALGNDLKNYASQVIKSISGEIGTEIKIQIKDILSDKPIIPGSSLKGSLRTVIYNLLRKPGHVKETDIFGSIDKDVFRYVTVHDVFFNATSFSNTKTYNLRNEKNKLVGGWKHELRFNTSHHFNTSGFTFPVECISSGDCADFSLVINQGGIRNAIKNKSIVHNHEMEQLLTGDEKAIFHCIRTYTDKYLRAELQFFKRYEGEHADIIIEEIERLIAMNDQWPILRIGFGSGFHAMTGDTLHSSHDINGVGRGNRGLLNDVDSTKSRKLAFKINQEELQLYPMGFVQFCSNDYYDTQLKINHEKWLEARVLRKIEAQVSVKSEEEIIIPSEDKKIPIEPTMVNPASLIKAKMVFAKVVGQKGKMIQFIPYVDGFGDKIFEMSYAAGLPIDTIIQVMCISIKGKALQFQGSPKIM